MLFRLSLAVAVLPFCSAQLDYYAKKAGLKYFGTATDSPGQRERAGQEAAYPQYDAILRDTKEFGQMTPANGQKVSRPPDNYKWSKLGSLANTHRS